MRRSLPCLSALLLLAVAAGCGCREPAPPAAAPRSPRIETFSSGPVTATLTINPSAVRLDQDTLLTLRVVSPSNVTAALPTLESRIEGFVVAGAYDRQPESRDGRITRERHVQLTPRIAARYRIAPMPIVWTRTGEKGEQWFPTRSILLETEPLAKETPSALAAPRSPFHVPPDPATLLAYAGGILLFLALAYLAWRLLRRVHRAIQLKRMSPRERALFELNELLQRRLIEKNKVKEFYFELTMIVRCYIERAHAIRAPEQTTEEFLNAVGSDTRFPASVVSRLRAFLSAADLVKYAAFRPDPATVEQATSTARTYIETDSSTTIAHQPLPIAH